MKVTGYQIHVFDLPMGRLVGDCNKSFDRMSIGALEVRTDSEHTGLGFFSGRPLPPASELWTELHGLAGDLVGIDVDDAQTRSGTVSWRSHFRQAIDQALWDLRGKALGVPLYRLLGGTDPRVQLYASGLDFPLSTDAACEFFRSTAELGFRAFKLKVGFEDLHYEIDRILAIRDVVGSAATVMLDANDAWSSGEAIVRLNAYRAAGLDIFWAEDPCAKADTTGYRELADAVPFTHINRGEGVDLDGKLRILADGSIGVLNLGGHISDGLTAAAARPDDVLVTVGNNVCSVGVHLSSALPGALWMEHSFLDWNVILDEPVRIEDGFAVAPNRPGHGLSLAAEFLEDADSTGDLD